MRALFRLITLAIWLVSLIALPSATGHAVEPVGQSMASWGHNFWEQSSNNSVYATPYPAYLPGRDDFTAVSAGFKQTLALDRNKNVWQWGGARTLHVRGPLAYASVYYTGFLPETRARAGLDQELAIPDVTASSPRLVAGLTDVIAISSGASHNLALKSDGTVWAWGLGLEGQLGDGTGRSQATPVKVSGLAGVTGISAGYAHSMAVTSDGSVWVWGWNGWGQLGTGGTADAHVPVKRTELASIVAVAAGALHSLALQSDGTVWGWGSSQFGAVGTGLGGVVHWAPIAVHQATGLRNITAISAGGYHSLALRSDGRVFSWGYGALGQNGNGSRANAYYPAIQDALGGIIKISAGLYHSMALSSDGLAWAWGNNQDGQLGRGSMFNDSAGHRPVSSSAQTAAGLGPWFLKGATDISAGGYHSLALVPRPPSSSCQGGEVLASRVGADTYDLNITRSIPSAGKERLCIRVSTGGATAGGALDVTNDGQTSSPATLTRVANGTPCSSYQFHQMVSTLPPFIPNAFIYVNYGNPTSVCLRVGEAWNSVSIGFTGSVGKITWTPDQA